MRMRMRRVRSTAVLLVVLVVIALLMNCHSSVLKKKNASGVASIAWRHSLLQVRGGAANKKKLGLGSMIKSFWLSLIDPGNEEGLQQEKNADKGKNGGKESKGGMFGGKKKSKGRSLK